MAYNSTARRPDGYAITVDPDKPPLEVDTKQCVHCGCHFNVVAGSGTKRGFCLKCMGVTCGKPECNICRPFERWLYEVENRSR